MAKMIYHRFKCSQKTAWRYFHYLSYTIPFVVFVASCQPAGPEPNITSTKPPQVVAETVEHQVAQITDQILMDLATRNHDHLPHYFDPAVRQSVTGQDIAARLLGPHFQKVILERWDAQKIQIQQLGTHHVHARIEVFYSRIPNHRSGSSVLSFYYVRSGQGKPWYLKLPR